ncbi:YihY/virulence factor BrkB family protein [Metaclostridioides mangenotii]|uniref:YihY/virulence factor BrkB family protein n=1 Tax=Metaclostridioides mangenotii TaxID=1540 RepID=UPI0004644775|nr:YihY/virulence factor BrkB family protein [Clostridioides mangenotii]
MLSIYNKLREIVNRLNYSELSSRTAELSFFILLSIFPFLLCFISGVAYIPEFHINKYSGLFASIMPTSVFDVLSSIIVSAIDNRNLKFLCMSFILTMWATSRAVKALIKGMNKSYRVKETRSFFKIMFISFFFTFILLLLIFMSIIFLIYGEKIGLFLFTFVGLDHVFLTLWNVLRYSITIIMIIVVFIILYKYTPNKKINFRDVVPGSVFATFSWFLVSYLYSYYTNHWANYEAIYGSIAEIIVLITWIYFSSWVITIGYELNIRLYYRRNSILTKKIREDYQN